MSTTNIDGTDLSRSPTPTGQEDVSDIETSTIDTEIEGDYDESWVDDSEFYINNPTFGELVTTLKNITAESVDPAVGTDSESLRKYYSRKWREVAEDEKFNAPLMIPACPHIILTAVSKDERDFGGCYCCMADDLPKLRIDAGQVGGGVITMRAVVERFRRFLYGEEDDEEAAIQALATPVEGLSVGEAGVTYCGWMISNRDGERQNVMGFELFLDFAKPLAGGGYQQVPPRKVTAQEFRSPSLADENESDENETIATSDGEENGRINVVEQGSV